MRSLLLAAGLLSAAQAWLPFDNEGQLRMRRSTVDERNEIPAFDSVNETNTARGIKQARWLPMNPTIRGVNLGSLFVFEPWIGVSTWTNKMGCTDSGYNSEFDCMLKLGANGDAVFQQHWRDWITEQDFDEMISYGLNTVRIPLGYWIYEDIVDQSEHFPKGGLDALIRICGYASDRHMFIILEYELGLSTIPKPRGAVANQRQRTAYMEHPVRKLRINRSPAR